MPLRGGSDSGKRTTEAQRTQSYEHRVMNTERSVWDGSVFRDSDGEGNEGIGKATLDAARVFRSFPGCGICLGVPVSRRCPQRFVFIRLKCPG